MHLIWYHDSLHLDLPAIHAQDAFHFSRVMTLAQQICTLVAALPVMPFYFLCSFVLIQCIIMVVTLNRCNYNTRATISSKKIDKCRWSTLHMAQLYRQLLNETGRHRLLYIICIFMQAQPWMSKGLNDGRGSPWCTTMNICTFIIVNCWNIVSCQLCDTGWVCRSCRVETKKRLVDLLPLFTSLPLAWKFAWCCANCRIIRTFSFKWPCSPCIQANDF